MGRLFQIRDINAFNEPIWSQQKDYGETNEYYAMFLSFCNVSPSHRSLNNTWREWTKDAGYGQHPSTTYKQIASAFHWIERAAARDVQELRERYSIWSERDWDWREGDYKTGETLRKQAERAIEHLNSDDFKPDIQTIISMLQTASSLQKGSIPNIGALSSTQVQDILAALPDSKRKRVLRIVMAEYKEEGEASIPDDQSDIIDAEVKSLPTSVGRRKSSRKSVGQE